MKIFAFQILQLKVLFNYGTFRNIFNAQAKAREFCAYYTLIFPYNNSWGTNKSILWAEWNTFNKTFESSLNLRALFFGIIKTKLWSTVELKLSPITQTNKFRNCSAFDCPKFLLFSSLFPSVSWEWWISTPSDMCQSFGANQNIFHSSHEAMWSADMAWPI